MAVMFYTCYKLAVFTTIVWFYLFQFLSVAVSNVPTQDSYSENWIISPGNWKICSPLCSTAYTLTWIRPPQAVPFRPGKTFSLSTVLCTLLLLMSGDVEINPGPAHSDTITVGSLNCRSAIKHAAEVWELVCSESLDVAALCETWTRLKAHDAVNRDFVPDGYDVINEPRTDGRPGRGLAVLFKSNLNVVKITSSTVRTTFDLLIAAIG